MHIHLHIEYTYRRHLNEMNNQVQINVLNSPLVSQNRTIYVHLKLNCLVGCIVAGIDLLVDRVNRQHLIRKM